MAKQYVIEEAGALPVLDGAALINLTSGNLVGALPALDGSLLTNIDADTVLGTTITGAGTIATGGFTLTITATGTAMLLSGTQTVSGTTTFAGPVIINENVRALEIRSDHVGGPLGALDYGEIGWHHYDGTNPAGPEFSIFFATNGVAPPFGVGDRTLNIYSYEVGDNVLSIGDNGKVRLVPTTGQLFVPYGTASLPSIAFFEGLDIDGNTGIYAPAENEIGIATDGVGRFIVNSTGNILPVADASYDFGSGALRFKDGQFSGTVTAGFFSGNGSLLTNLSAVTGSGTTSFIPRFTSSMVVGDSSIKDDTNLVEINPGQVTGKGLLKVYRSSNNGSSPIAISAGMSTLSGSTPAFVYLFYARAPETAVPITNHIGYYVEGIPFDAGAVITNNYGIYIATSTAGTTKYSLYSAGASAILLNTGTIQTSAGYVSTMATGTSPLTVTSTTLCTNLNADFVRGATITGTGTIALGGFTLTVPATGTAALLGTANSFTLRNTFAIASADTPNTQAQFTGNQDNLVLTVISGFQRWSSDASRDVTGVVAGTSGQYMTIVNVGAQNIVLKDQVTSTAANQFLCTAGDVTLTPNQGAYIIYDTTVSKWRVFKLV